MLNTDRISDLELNKLFIWNIITGSPNLHKRHFAESVEDIVTDSFPGEYMIHLRMAGDF